MKALLDNIFDDIGYSAGHTVRAISTLVAIFALLGTVTLLIARYFNAAMNVSIIYPIVVFIVALFLQRISNRLIEDYKEVSLGDLVKGVMVYIRSYFPMVLVLTLTVTGFVYPIYLLVSGDQIVKLTVTLVSIITLRLLSVSRKSFEHNPGATPYINTAGLFLAVIVVIGLFASSPYLPLLVNWMIIAGIILSMLVLILAMNGVESPMEVKRLILFTSVTYVGYLAYKVVTFYITF